MQKEFYKYIIREHQSIQESYHVIDANNLGTVLVVNDRDQVTGVATDGDIRRYLLEDRSVKDQISNCINTNFKYVTPTTKRENVLKLLDSGIKLLPVIHEDGKLHDVYTRDYFPLGKSKKSYVRSVSPVRISFGGGGSDLTYYFLENQGVVINSTISLYCHASLRKREDWKIRIYSHDLRKTLVADSYEEAIQQTGEFDLFISLLKLVEPKYGFEMQIGSDFPIGSGLGGSAVVLSAMTGCFNQFRQEQWDSYEIAEIAFQAERINMQVAGGWQDQYASVFGGFNFIEFHQEQNIVHPLRITTDVISELEENSVLCYTGIKHNSGEIHKDQKAQSSKPNVQKKMDITKQLTYEIRNCLLRGNLQKFGNMLHEAWNLKKQFSQQISNSFIDNVYQAAIDAGALGGKLLGAGGGGFFYFYVPPFKKFEVMEALEAQGLEIKPFRFVDKGLQTWMTRETL